ncbi:MAG TPA: MMPL family transporter [Prolixibacteraceae bacterium]|nr:MMPL family transporter [Prolixibacteraceae bacterium]
MKSIINFILKRRNILLIIILLLTVGFSLKLGKVEMHEDEETFISPSDSVMIKYREFQKKFETDEGVVVAFESPNLFSKSEIQYLSSLHKKLEQLPGVTEVTSLINADKVTGVADGIEINSIIDTTMLDDKLLMDAKLSIANDPMFEGVYLSSDHKVASIIVTIPGVFDGGTDSLNKAFYTELVALVNNEKDINNRDLHIGGDLVTDAAIGVLMDRDMAVLFPISLLFCALVLFISFRKLVTTLVPLIPVLLAIVWVLGLKGWTGIPMTPISITLFPLIMVIGLANSIHIISHYRKIRPQSPNSIEAMKETLSRVIKPSFMAAFTTAIGFGSLVVSNVIGISQMGFFAAFGIMAAYFLSFIIIPSVLVSSNIFSNEKLVEKNSKAMDWTLHKINWLNQNHTWKIVLAFILVFVVMAMYIPRIKVEGSMASFAKEKTKLRNDIRFLDERLSGINSYELIISGEENAFKNPEILRKIDKIEMELVQNPDVLKVFGVSNLVKIINKALNSDKQEFFRVPETGQEVAQYLFLYEISGGDELSSFVNEDYSTARITIRTKQMSNEKQKVFIENLHQITSSQLGTLKTEVSGFGMLMSHINDNLIETQIESIIMALGIILALMFVMFGWKGGFLSILPNIFPIVFFLGLMGIIGIDLNMATSIIASVTIGIVVDDTIHIFFRQREEMKELDSPLQAITTSLLKIGAAMCVTSLLLVIGFGILSISASKFIADFGLLSASAIAAALLADLFISPILLEKAKLFQKKN